jgi:signal transduction histidine kinase/CheY-like chemotaxis protein
VLRGLRPAAIACMAGLSFAAVVHFYHSRFEQDILRRFQQYQVTLAESLGASLENNFHDLVNGLQVLSARPEMTGSPAECRGFIDTFYQLHSDVLENVTVLDEGGQAVCSVRPPRQENSLATRPESGEPASGPITYACLDGGERVRVTLAGGQSGKTICCDISVPRLLAKNLANSEGRSHGLCLLMGPGGGQVYPSLQEAAQPQRFLQQAVVRQIWQPCLQEGRSDSGEVREGGQTLLVSYNPLILGQQRYGVCLGLSKGELAIPLSSHQRMIYALIAALALLYFATGYVSARSEKAHLELERQKRLMAEASSRVKSNLLTRMTNEIRTPMSSILDRLARALDKPLPQDQRAQLEGAGASAQSLLNVINDMLDFSQLESGKLELAEMDFDLCDCLEDTLLPLREAARAKGLSLDLLVNDDVPARLRGDPGRLRQIVDDLAGNAVRFTDQGGIRVTVQAEEESDHSARLGFAVSDTGIGIAAADQARVFQAPPLAESSPARQVRTRLGLAICRQLVEQMGGQLRLHSQPGKGSTFYFSLEFRQARFAPAAPAPARQELIHGRALAYWPQSPEPGALAGVLAACDIECRVTGDIQEAFNLMRQAHRQEQPFSLLLVEGEGIDALWPNLVNQVKRDQELRQTPVVLICSAGLRGDAVRCQAAGVDVYLTKPVDPSLLRQAIMALTNRTDQELLTRHSLREQRCRAAAAGRADSSPKARSLRAENHRTPNLA